MKVGSNDEGSFNYCLNDDETLRKMKMNAKIKDVEVLPLKNDNTIRIQLSTGAYILTMAHLIKFLMNNVGKKFNVEVTKGLDITLDNVKREHENRNITTEWKVHLTVDGEKVTFTCYETTHKLMLQGKSKHEEYADKVLIPYLKDEILMNQKKIVKLNHEILEYDKTKVGDKKTAIKAKNKTKQPTRFSPRTGSEAAISSLPIDLENSSPKTAPDSGRMTAAAFFDTSLIAIESYECEVCCETFTNQASLDSHVESSHVPPSSKAIDLTASQKLILPVLDVEDVDVDDDEDDDDLIASTGATAAQVQDAMAAASDDLNAERQGHTNESANTFQTLAMVHTNETGDGDRGHQVIVYPRKRENFLVPASPPASILTSKSNETEKVSGNGHEDEIEVVGEENLNLQQMWKRIIALEAQVKKLSQAAPQACKHTCPQAPKPPPEKHHTYATVANNSITRNTVIKTNNAKPKEFKPAERPKGKIDIELFADSISRNVVGPAIEKATGSLLRITRAYAAQEDDLAKFPNKTVSKVVRRHQRPVHTAILGAPSVDITNQQTGDRDVHDDNLSATIASSHSIVESAEYLINSGKAKQVIVMEHCPRYDDDAKARLASIANKTLHTARNQSQVAEKILVGRQTGLECSGDERRRRFTNDGTNSNSKHVRIGAYDQLHMYSQEGANAITKSFLNILKQGGLVRDKKTSTMKAHPPQLTKPHEWQKQKPRNGFQPNQRNRWQNSESFEIPTQNRFQVLW